jgi:hypothetical protein
VGNSAREWNNGNGRGPRVRTEINLKGEPLIRARSANNPHRARHRASVIVAVIILIGRNGQAWSDAVIGICSLSRAIDGAVRVANYSILCARHMSDKRCEGCKGRDYDSAHCGLLADLRFFLMARLWLTSVDNPVDADSWRSAATTGDFSHPAATCQRQPTGTAVNDHFHKHHESARILTLSAIVSRPSSPRPQAPQGSGASFLPFWPV